MDWLFGRRMTPEEMLRKNKRALDKAIRDLDRERARMEAQEKKIIMDIKKMAKEGQMVMIFPFETISDQCHLLAFHHAFCYN